jgi:tetratricopeptide (TPR) repeat protein
MNRSRLWPAVPILLGALAYAPAPTGELVWDDQYVAEYQVPHFDSLADILRPPPDIARWSYSYYRPLVTLSYLLDQKFFGAGATAGPHAMNVLWHLLVVFGVWHLARRALLGSPHAEGGAVVAASLFAIHPIHTESVSWIAGRSDVLAALFLMPALLLALRWCERRSATSAMALIASAPLFGLALLAKEQALTGLALLPLLALALSPPADSGATPGSRAPLLSAAIALLLWVAVAVGYFWLRMAAGAPPAAIQDLALAERATRAAAAAAWYAVKAVVPWPQSAIVTWDMVPGAAATAAVLVPCAALTALGAWRRIRCGDGITLLATGWFWIAISLPLWVAVVAVVNTPLAERYLYLPTVGVALGAGALVAAAPGRGWRVNGLALSGLVLVAFLAGTLQRGLVWRSSLALWSDTVERVTDQGMPWENLGLSHMRLGQDAQALDAFRRAAVIETYEARGRARARNAIGSILAKRGETEAAIAEYRRAVALNPAYAEAWYGLAAAYETRAERFHEQGQTSERDAAADLAIHFYRTAFQRYAGYYPARLKLAAALAAQGARLEAEGRSGPAVKLYGEALQTLNALQARLALDRRADALERLAREVGVDPQALRRELERRMAAAGSG